MIGKTATLFAAALCTAAPALAQTATLDWKVNGGESAIVNPGESVLVEGFLSWTAQGIGLSSADYGISITGANASDGLTYTEPAFGRNFSFLSPAPQTIVDAPSAAGVDIKAAGPSPLITAFQFPGAFNPLFSGSNPIRVFSFMVAVGDADRTLTIGGELASTAVYTDMFGSSSFVSSRSVDGATIQVVPTPGVLALAGSAGLIAARRRRHA